MKKSTLKKVFAFMLALVLAFAMSVPAFAATAGDEYTVTITPGDYTDKTKTDRYKAYEIFTGDLTTPATTDDEKNQLSNIQWGADIDVESFVQALIDDEDNLFGGAFDDLGDFTDPVLQANAVAKILDNNTHPTADTAEAKAAAEAFARAFAKVAQENLKEVCTEDDADTDTNKSHPVASEYKDGEFTIGLEKSGYYLIVDEYEGDEDGDIISEHILQVVRDRDIDVKSDTPEVEKDILTRDGKGEYEIGEKITFQLVGTLAENFKNFVGDYYYAFVDTMSKGLTLDEDSIEVKVYSLKDDGSLNAEITTITLTKGDTAPDGNYTVSVDDGDDDATVITIAFDNLKEIENLLASYVIVVTYDAYINGDAVIGTPETNAVKIEFSNDPYNEESTTNTPPDEVEVQTFELDIVKKDSVSGNPLSGVKFKLYKESSPSNVYGKFTGNAGSYTVDTANAPLTAWTASKTDGTELVTDTDGKLNIKGLAPGTYYLEEVETPSGYNALPGPIKIDITATYYQATDTEVTSGQKEAGELKTVTATYTINGQASALANAGTTSGTLGIVTLEVLNVPISSLPGTGGIGNYIFYIGGGLLVAAAIAFLFVSKKKSAKN